MVKLSILIPYYNTYEYTIKLLKELSIQKTDDIEVILIDDGCNEKKFDAFTDFKTIHLKKNVGMSDALNVGLDNAKGEYIAFIDSDDMITMDYVDILLDVLKTHDEEIIYFNWADFNENIITRKPSNYALWKAIYKRDIFPRFEEGRRKNNDVPVQKELRKEKHSEYYIDRVLYIYNSNRIDSITWQINQEIEKQKKELSIIIAYYKTYDLTKELLSTLVNQITDECEIIVVDDGCDEIRLDEFNKEMKIIHLEENVGGAKAYNIGVDNANSKYIGFIDSDDMVTNDYIETLLDAIKTRNEDAIFMNWQDKHSGRIIENPDNYAYWKAIYKKEILPRFEDGMKYAFDVPFYEQLNAKQYSKFYLGKVLYIYNSNRKGSLTWERNEIRRKEMLKLETIKNFTLKDYEKLLNVKRARGVDVYGQLTIGDTFECDDEMAKYLMGNNTKGEVVAKVVEMIPDEEEQKEEEVTEEVVQAVASAIVEEAQEKDKEVEEVVNEIIEEAKEDKKHNRKKKKNAK